MSNQLTKTQNWQPKITNRKVPRRFVLVVPFVLQVVMGVGLTSYLCFGSGQQAALLHLTALGVTIALGLVTAQWMVKPILQSSNASQATVSSEMDQRIEDEEDAPVNELGQMAQLLRESLEKFTKVFRASPDPIVISTLAEGRFIDVNDTFLSLFGYTREEVIGFTSVDLGLWINPEGRDQVKQRLQAEGVIRNLKFDYCTKSGEIKTLLLSAEIIEIDKQACILLVSKDITERKQAEASLKDSEAKLSSILSSAEAVIARFRLFTNRDWTYEYFSSGTEAIFGYSPEELQANKTLWISRMHPEDVEIVIPQLFEGIFAERKTKVEFRFQHRDGTWRWISDTIVPHRDKSADCWVVTCVEIDITDRKLAEAALHQREQEFRALAENAPDVIARLDREFRYLYINPKVEQKLRLPPSAFIGKTDRELGFPKAMVSPWHTLLQRVFETGQEHGHEHRFPSPQGLTYWSSRVVPEFASDGSVESVLVVSRDITELKQAEEAIRSQAQREQALNRVIQAIRNSLNLTTIFSTTVSEIGQLLQVDRVEIVQYLPEQRVWLHVADYNQNPDLPGTLGLEVPDEGNLIADQLKQLKVVRLDDASSCEDEINQALAQAFPGGSLLVPIPIGSGSSLWGSLTLMRIQCPSLWQDSEVALARTVADQLAIAIQQSTLLEQVQTELNERRQVEEELQTAKVAAEAANQAKSKFLATMSHEIRTPLNAVTGMTTLLLNTELRPKQREFVQTIRQSSDALLTIINDILDFSKIEFGKLELEQQIFDLQLCVEQSLSLMAVHAAEKGLTLAYSIAPSSPRKIFGDAARLSQILVNLLSNAVKFTEAGEVAVAVTAQKVTEPSNTYEIQFAVKDTGIGILHEQMEQLFKPFSQVDVSISRRYGGTGLGLAICKQLVELMGGRIWVESQVGIGSTFYFTLFAQVSDVQVDTPQLESREALPRIAQHLPLQVLLAEDNRVNQQVALLLLEQLGYQADAVSNGLEVLQALRRQPYDVVIMDIHMPEMDGLTATRQISQEWPPQQRPRIIALTAYATQENWQQCLEAGIDDYITKPIQLAKLVHVLTQCQPLALQRESVVVLPPLHGGSCDDFVKSEDLHSSLHFIERAEPYKPNSLASKSSDVLNRKTLQALRHLAGARATEVLEQLINNYLEDAPQLLQAMRDAVAKEDAAALRQAAHKLRGASANLGATTLSQLCKTLEAMGVAGTTAGALAGVLQVEVEYETVKATLQLEMDA
jgi:PAS domain S-box-containing protein